MSKTEKLIAKLKNKKISAAELRTLLIRLGWICRGQEGSHESWVGPAGERFTLATHSKEVKPYMLKEISKKLGL